MKRAILTTVILIELAVIASATYLLRRDRPAAGNAPAAECAQADCMAEPDSLRVRAEKGDVRAQYDLAVNLNAGVGGARDQKQSIYWLHRAAAAGLTDAQYRLGRCYAEGAGVLKNPGEAERLFAEVERKTGKPTPEKPSGNSEYDQPAIRYGDYRIKVSSGHVNAYEGDYGDSKLEVFKSGRRVYAAKSTHFYVGHAIDGLRPANSQFTVGKNITGDGKPSLVVRAWNLNNDRCYQYLVFELGPTFRVVQEFCDGSRLGLFKQP